MQNTQQNKHVSQIITFNPKWHWNYFMSLFSEWEKYVIGYARMPFVSYKNTVYWPPNLTAEDRKMRHMFIANICPNKRDSPPPWTIFAFWKSDNKSNT